MNYEYIIHSQNHYEMINVVWLNRNYRPEMFVFHSPYIITVQIALARTIDLPSGISAKY